MTQYTYRIVPAPAKAPRASGVKGTEARFARGLEVAINALAADGWEYLRADTLPSEERAGLIGSRTVNRSVLVFRRPAGVRTPAPAPQAIPQTVPEAEPGLSRALFARRDPPRAVAPAPARGANTLAKDETDASDPAGEDTPRR